jgi:hypothetical protein
MMKNARLITAIYIVLIGLYAAYWGFFLAAPGTHRQLLQGEDLGVEWITVIAFMGAAAMAWSILRFRHKAGRKTLAFFALLGLFFFVCGGEEISWGQRIFGFETPEKVAAVNEQGEFNIHNLEMEHFHPKDIVSWFMKLFGIILPFVLLWKARDADHPAWRYISPPALIPAFLIPEVIALIEDPMDDFMTRRVMELGMEPMAKQSEEVMEMYWALCACAAMILIYKAWKRYRTEAAAAA